MVRLKAAYNEGWKPEIGQISIPYGSIKSRCFDASYPIDIQMDN